MRTLAAALLLGLVTGAVAEESDVVIEVRSGRTLLHPGEPLEGAWVAPASSGQGPADVAADALAADGEGRVVLGADAAGALLLVWADGSAPQAVWVAGHSPEPLSLAPGRQLAVRVQAPSGKPVPDAEVTLGVRLPVAGSAPKERAVQTYRVTALTDAHGYATIADLPHDSLSVTATADGWVDAVPATAHPRDGGVTLTLRRGAAIRGVVRQVPGGAPAEGAVVVARAPPPEGADGAPGRELRTTVDVHGAFELGPLPPGAQTLHVASPEHVLAEPVELVLGEGEQREGLIVTVWRTSTLAGRVRGPDGEPRPESTLALLWPARLAPAGARERTFSEVIDDEGRYRLDGLRPGDGITVEVRCPGLAPLVVGGVSLPAGGEAAPLDLRLQAGAAVRGVVRGPAGLPSPGTRVEAWRAGDGTERPPVAITTCDDGGAFVLRGLPLTPVRLRLSPAEGASGAAAWHGPVIGGKEPVDLGELALEHGWSMRVVVRHAPDGAVARVLADGEELGERELDGDGAATFSGLPWGLLDVVVGTPERPDGARAVVSMPRDLLELAWDVTVRVDGVLQTADGAPVATATLVAEPLRPSERRDGLTDAPASGPAGETLTFAIRDVEGIFAIELAPGPWRLSARSGTLHGAIDLTVRSDLPTRAVLPLVPGERLRGEIASRATGGPLEGARVEAEPVSGPAGVPVVARSDARGRFELTGLESGIVRLRITAAGHAPYETLPVAVRRAEMLDVGRIELLEGVRVEGTVYADGVPSAGLPARVAHDDGWEWETSTDLHGRFVVEGVPPGGVVVTVADRSRRVEVPGAKERFSVVIDLSSGTHLVGRVMRDARPLAYARVTGWTVAAEPVETSTLTDAMGRYRLPRLPPGPIGVEVLPAGASDGWETTLALPVADSHHEDLELPAGGISGEVRAEVGNDPVPGAFVWLWQVGEDERLERVVARTTTDAEGGFRFEGAASGRYEVEARRDGKGGAHSVPFSIRDGVRTLGVRVLLPEESSVRAEIVDGGGRTVPRAWLSAQRTDDRAAPVRLRAYAPASGRVRLRGLGPGAWEIAVGAPGRGRVPLGVVTLSGGEEDLGRVHLERSGALRVAMLHPGGYPAEGYEIVLEDVLGRDPRPVAEPQDHLRPRDTLRRTGPDGTLVVSDLAPGAYTVRPRHADVDLPFPVRIEPGDVSHVFFWVPWPDEP